MAEKTKITFQDVLVVRRTLRLFRYEKDEFEDILEKPNKLKKHYLKDLEGAGHRYTVNTAIDVVEKIVINQFGYCHATDNRAIRLIARWLITNCWYATTEGESKESLEKRLEMEINTVNALNILYDGNEILSLKK